MQLCESNYYAELDNVGAVKCFYKESFPLSSMGEYAVRCFTAKDPHGDRAYSTGDYGSLLEHHPPVTDGLCYGTQNLDRDCRFQNKDWNSDSVMLDDYKRLTCRSVPMCFKIKISGKAPRFVSPTPLELNSFDSTGKLVQGRTDVAACEGYELDLVLAAEDEDEGDEVRIFVEDRDEDTRVARLLDLQLRGMAATETSEPAFHQTFNLDFFDNTTIAFPPACAGTSKAESFLSFGGVREGDNSAQENILALNDSVAERPKSVMSSYFKHIEFRKRSLLAVRYLLDVTRRNGITIRMASASVNASEEQNCFNSDASPDAARCRCVYVCARARSRGLIQVMWHAVSTQGEAFEHGPDHLCVCL